MTADHGHDVASLALERERAIELLSRNFAQDVISLEELERRIEQAYKAQTVSAVRDLTRDLPESTAAVARRDAPVPAAFAPESDRIVSVMAETVRRGVWQPARNLRVLSVMSETHLDLTEARLSSGVTEIALFALMTTVKLIVPPGVRVVVQPTAFMSSVSDEAFNPPAVGSGAPVIRITGTVIMGELKISVRTRELPVDDS